MEVDGYNQALVIAFDVEYNSLAGNDAGRAKLRLQFCRIFPDSLFDFGIPRIQMLLYGCSKASIHSIGYESVEGRSGNDSHFIMILCSRFGSKNYRRAWTFRPGIGISSLDRLTRCDGPVFRIPCFQKARHGAPSSLGRCRCGPRAIGMYRAAESTLFARRSRWASL